MSTFYESPNDYRNYLMHYGVKGMKWRNHRRSQMSKFGRLEERRNQDEANAAGQRHEDYLTERSRIDSIQRDERNRPQRIRERYISEQENKKRVKEQREQQIQEEQRRRNKAYL